MTCQEDEPSHDRGTRDATHTRHNRVDNAPPLAAITSPAGLRANRRLAHGLWPTPQRVREQRVLVLPDMIPSVDLYWRADSGTGDYQTRINIDVGGQQKVAESP